MPAAAKDAKEPMLGYFAFPASATHVSGRRLFAHLLDSILFGALYVGLSLPLAVLTDVGYLIFLVLGATVGLVAFYVLVQRHSGQTPGKRILDIKVVEADGGIPTTGALARRSIPLVFEYVLVFAFISMMTSDHRQRLGDRWGDTYVIRASTEPAINPPRSELSRGEVQARAAAERAERDARWAAAERAKPSA